MKMRSEAAIVREWSRQKSISRLLIDLDGTQCRTDIAFEEKKLEAGELLTKQAGLDPQTWIARIDEVDNKGYERFGVTPDRWLSTVAGIIEIYGLAPGLGQPLIEIFNSIYTTPLQLLDGVEETLEIFGESAVPIATVTHADVAWTWRKYEWLELSRWYAIQDIYIVNAHGHKDATAWKNATKFFGVPPKNCVTIGDSKRSDIKPSQEIGILHCFLVEGNEWSVQDADVHSSVISVSGMREIPRILERLLE